MYVDRGFLARYLPELDAYLHYRLIDVSTIKELARRWYPRSYFNAPAKTGGHRALADIRESIAELRYYRDTLFVAGARAVHRRGPGRRDEPCRGPCGGHFGGGTARLSRVHFSPAAQ